MKKPITEDRQRPITRQAVIDDNLKRVYEATLAEDMGEGGDITSAAVIPADAGISSCVGANHYCSEGTVSRLFAIPADAGLSQVGGDWPRSPDPLVHRFQHSGALSTGADRR